MKRPLRILHIDDDLDTRFLIRELLSEVQRPDDEVGIEWLEAGGIEEAVERWREVALDGLLVDNRLGVRVGVEEIPGLRSVWNCPIWIVSGAPDPELLGRAVRNGAQGLLHKDDLLLDGRHLQVALRRITGHSQPADSPEETLP
jgi:CheY-like chemotaxis protein